MKTKELEQLNALEIYDQASLKLAHVFFEYYFEEEIGLEDIYLLGNGLFEFGDVFFDVKTMQQVLKETEKYTPKIVKTWYKYSIDEENSDNDEARALSLGLFTRHYKDYELANTYYTFGVWYNGKVWGEK